MKTTPSFKKSYLSTIKSKRDAKEIEKIIDTKKEIEKLELELKGVTDEIKEYQLQIKELFTRSNSKETQLKSYIAKLTNSINEMNVKIDSSVLNKKDEIEELIVVLQEIIKNEINFTKVEMEKEINSKFTQAEKEQNQLMTMKIEEQKKVLEKMNKTRKEIEGIRFEFEKINVQCDRLGKEHSTLKTLLSSLEEDNICMVEKINSLKEEYFKLKLAHKKVFKEQSELVGKIEEIFGIDTSLNNSHNDSEVEENQKKMIKSYEDFVEYRKINEKDDLNSFNSKSNISKVKNKEFEVRNGVEDDHIKKAKEDIKSIKNNIKQVENKNKTLKKEYLKEFQMKNEAQQLMQKCIEDLKFDFVKVTKDISLFNKNGKGFSITEMSSKMKYKEDLEDKLKIMTFVYDNAFMYDELIKNSFFCKK